MIMDLTSTAQPLKSHLNFKENGILGQNFLRLRRAKRGFAWETVPDSPESATLAVTIIPVSPAVGVRTGAHNELWAELRVPPHGGRPRGPANQVSS